MDDLNHTSVQLYHDQYSDPMKLMFDVDPDNPNHQKVLGAPMMMKKGTTDATRFSYQSPNANNNNTWTNSMPRRNKQQINVYNSVHLPSLRGNSSSLHEQ